MTEALDNAINEIVAVLSNVSGLRDVPVNPPESIGAQTFAVVYPYTGNIQIGETGTRMALHDIAIDVLTTRTDLARDIQLVKPFIDTVSHAIELQVSYDSDGNAGSLFNHSIDTFARLSYTWIGQSDYAGVAVVGYHFLMEAVKIRTNL